MRLFRHLHHFLARNTLNHPLGHQVGVIVNMRMRIEGDRRIIERWVGRLGWSFDQTYQSINYPGRQTWSTRSVKWLIGRSTRPSRLANQDGKVERLPQAVDSLPDLSNPSIFVPSSLKNHISSFKSRTYKFEIDRDSMERVVILNILNRPSSYDCPTKLAQRRASRVRSSRNCHVQINPNSILTRVK